MTPTVHTALALLRVHAEKVNHATAVSSQAQNNEKGEVPSGRGPEGAPTTRMRATMNWIICAYGMVADRSE